MCERTKQGMSNPPKMRRVLGCRLQTSSSTTTHTHTATPPPLSSMFPAHGSHHRTIFAQQLHGASRNPIKRRISGCAAQLPSFARRLGVVEGRRASDGVLLARHVSVLSRSEHGTLFCATHARCLFTRAQAHFFTLGLGDFVH